VDMPRQNLKSEARNPKQMDNQINPKQIS